MKQTTNTKKLALAGVLTALAIVGSFLSFPVAGSKCAPVQHMVNIFAAGSLMAFQGSMIGALCCGLVYKKCKNLSLTCLAEALGTGILGGIAAYPVALFLMGAAPAGLFIYVIPFLISTVAGSILAFLLISVFQKSGVMAQLFPTS